MDNINIIVPELPESVNDATIIEWYKKPGDIIKVDDILLELETDKIVLEIPSTINGILEKILMQKGEKVKSQQIIGILKKIENKKEKNVTKNSNLHNTNNINDISDINKKQLFEKINNFSPSIRRMINKNNLSINQNNNSTKKINKDFKVVNNNEKQKNNVSIDHNIKKIKMDPIRQYIAKKLMDSKKNTVMLTTFNEVNMKNIINIKNNYSDFIYKMHGIKLGFTSFHVKAVSQALQSFKKINAFIDGEYIIYNNFYNINIAIASNRGLVAPIIYNTNQLSLIDIEKKIKDLIIKSNTNKLSPEDLISGTFTISNGGIFGSLMSTPIINPPQSAILGIHAIKNRPVVIENKICIMPMMYLALSYDHRLIDGKEAISFLVLIKKLLEDPLRLFLTT
ncbi:dihydrolipoyllysine-residue succinyltransferase [Enterobacteriaceae endosymbiont of Donacia tomentosa]|uniref:dihydrolipoyllysine-residue succinyltransferase n=1 Tax=Enterobacteriaceae endosymbiont of Donacia tomentosa TaxID=2675787 RepID=UPI0014494E3C|nr:dihydrolipoyllysine-residue succinyltransferase [Enterobacteriaceae endosymbiont of Donacia tomentosa]QJC31642.1 dihydrolipoyllysine-residue succinyltransferase [Enterobacteriaceae endosymbiont of Donacia tomentosa]